MATLKELIKEKESNLNKIPNKLLTDIQKSEKEIYGKILTLISQLRQDTDGKILMDKRNIGIAAEISAELKTVLNTKSYLDSLREFANGFDTQAEANDDYFRKAFKGFKTVPAADAMLERAKVSALNQLLGAPAESSFIAPVQDIIDTAVSSGASYTDLVNQIKEFTLGTEDVDGKLAHHASTVAFDSFAFSDRAYTNIISEDLDAEWFLYSGTDQENSRPFCVERKGKYFHYKEVQDWAHLNWQGKADGTTEETIFIVAGGYRCIDSILPVSVSVVPREVIQRNLDNGNYNPSERELELLGL